MHLVELNEYDYWANKKILAIILENDEHREVSFLFHHILEANRLWYSRLMDHPAESKVWKDDFKIELFQVRVDTNYANLRSYIDSKDGIEVEELLHYKTLKGDSYTNKAEDILFHIFNHSTHHRAQIMSIWKQLNIDRPSLDYIFYKRN